MRRGLDVIEMDLIRTKAHEDMQKVITEAEGDPETEMDPDYTEQLKELIKMAQKTGLKPHLKKSSEMWEKLDKGDLSGGSADISGDGSSRKYRI